MLWLFLSFGLIWDAAMLLKLLKIITNNNVRTIPYEPSQVNHSSFEKLVRFASSSSPPPARAFGLSEENVEEKAQQTWTIVLNLPQTSSPLRLHHLSRNRTQVPQPIS